MVLGFTVGGLSDVTARLIAPKLYEHLGQPVVVENRGGAGGAIANERVATSPADGYTLLLLTNAATVLPALRARLPYDLERDLAPVSLVVIGPLVLGVHPSVPARNVKELIALARSHPGKLNYGSVGPGGAPHLSAELLKFMAKVNIVHVPYKGGA
ncbi:MAG: tripartite tricarboxylate transporter substrate binding protein, partial [Betaproteobacteria bacterium]|nr:tripartite tricarboxylate transporter substrate binding protein [Betaproteobacteria bacterium]